jgi:hypothetical protein
LRFGDDLHGRQEARRVREGRFIHTNQHSEIEIGRIETTEVTEVGDDDEVRTKRGRRSRR